MTSDGLVGGWDPHRLESMAGHCASRNFGRQAYLLYSERWEVAFSAILEHLESAPVVPEANELLRVGSNAIQRAENHYKRDQLGTGGRHFWAYWYHPPGSPDPVGERITERVATWQIAHALTELEWEALWAMSEAIKRGGTYHDAAALLGINRALYHSRLSMARRRFTALWHEGETPPRIWRGDRAPARGGRRVAA